VARSWVILLSAAVATVAHFTLGWLAVIPVAVLAGALHFKRGWLTGLGAILLSWSLIVLWSFVVAAGPTLEMTRALGELAGGLPAFAIVVATLVTAALLGAAGGAFGAAVRNIVR
jgi:hypothetical protein